MPPLLRVRIRLLALLLPAMILGHPQAPLAHPGVDQKNLTAWEDQNTATSLVEDGYHLVDLGASAVNDIVRLTTVWETAPGPTGTVSRDLSASEYASTPKKMEAEGYAPATSDTDRTQSRSQQEPPNKDGLNARDTSDADSWPTDQFDPTVLPAGVDEYRTAGTNLRDVSRRVGMLTNEERTKRGRAPLEFDEQLTLIACRHNKDMLAHDYGGHEDSDGRRVGDRLHREHRTLLVGRLGENVFQASGGYARRENLAPVPMKWWMDSPGHRENILRPQYTHIGACVSRKDDQMRSTQVFATPAGVLDEPLPWSVPPGETLSVGVSGSDSPIAVERYTFSPPEADNVLSRDETQPFDGTLRVPSEPGRYQLKVLYTTEGNDDFEFAAGPSIRVQAP